MTSDTNYATRINSTKQVSFNCGPYFNCFCYVVIAAVMSSSFEFCCSRQRHLRRDDVNVHLRCFRLSPLAFVVRPSNTGDVYVSASYRRKSIFVFLFPPIM